MVHEKDIMVSFDMVNLFPRVLINFILNIVREHLGLDMTLSDTLSQTLH